MFQTKRNPFKQHGQKTNTVKIHFNNDFHLENNTIILSIFSPKNSQNNAIAICIEFKISEVYHKRFTSTYGFVPSSESETRNVLRKQVENEVRV